MIVYNLRYDGPYEYDKWILNIFQLYNKVYKEKKVIKDHEIYSLLETLSNMILDKTVNQDLTELDNLELIAIERGV